MEWSKLLNAGRFGQASPSGGYDVRSQFERDYDRLVFSPEFRKLQSKTQVFPLPGEIFVHNRLTHSLEVASVGRSMARLAADALISADAGDPSLLDNIPAVVSTACLAHDMGNPPFGHSGEEALSSYFSEGGGGAYRHLFTDAQWADLTRFEGNANLFRLLTHPFKGRRAGGFALTYASLGAMVKYPFGAKEGRKKYGYFDSEKESFAEVRDACGLSGDPQSPQSPPARHPLVYLVEAADDVSYQIMDIEDAFRLGIITLETVYELLLPFVAQNPAAERGFRTRSEHLDASERVAYLRSLAINALVSGAAGVFARDIDRLMAGERVAPLVADLEPEAAQALERCQRFARGNIYADAGVRRLEVSGYKVLTTLMECYVEAMLFPERTYARLLLYALPPRYRTDGGPYERVRLATDYITGMTDTQAVAAFRELMGIDIPQRRV